MYLKIHLWMCLSYPWGPMYRYILSPSRGKLYTLLIISDFGIGINGPSALHIQWAQIPVMTTFVPELLAAALERTRAIALHLKPKWSRSWNCCFNSISPQKFNVTVLSSSGHANGSIISSRSTLPDYMVQKQKTAALQVDSQKDSQLPRKKLMVCKNGVFHSTFRYY